MPRSCLVNTLIPLEPKELKNWKYPLFVKPNCEGSSIGISSKNVCHNIEEVKNKVSELMSIFNELIIEEYVHGIDIPRT